ncbi:hypothetical protein ACFVAQ_11245 [Streptomyces sp. NPDC057651]|uniref:hypothetical protein n=1 Tax=Streptomyces sp. NPDC057651 TaxID=3346194 RepID=UPI0036BF4590
MTLPSAGRAGEAPSTEAPTPPAPRTGTAGNPGPAVPSDTPRPGPVTPPSTATRGAASPRTDEQAPDDQRDPASTDDRAALAEDDRAALARDNRDNWDGRAGLGRDDKAALAEDDRAALARDNRDDRVALARDIQDDRAALGGDDRAALAEDDRAALARDSWDNRVALARDNRDGRLALAGIIAAGVTAVLAALFGDWGTWSAPLGEGLPGFPLAWGVTAGPPVVLIALAGVFVAWAGAPSFARTWAHTAAALAAATGLLALLRLPVGPDTTWAALAEASHAGLFGLLAGWAPALAALAVTRRRAEGRTGLTPYVWVTALAAMAPLLVLAAGTAWSSPAHAALCTASECISPRAGLLFTGEVTLRLALPAWAAAIAVLAAARRAPRFRELRATWQILLALAAAGLAILLAPGLVLGAKI